MLAADDNLTCLAADTTAAAMTVNQAAGVELNHVKYSRATAKAADGSLIVDVRQQCKWRTEVRVEGNEDGSQSASLTRLRTLGFTK
jgi:hypothetical protein